MALVAKMMAQQVNQAAGAVPVPCDPEDEGARPVSEFDGAYGPPGWWPEGTTHYRNDTGRQATESFKLNAVSAKGEDDPNRMWAIWTPSGELSMTVQNPDAFGYIQAGAEYRITIQRIRGPRETAEDTPSGRPVEDYVNRVEAEGIHIQAAGPTDPLISAGPEGGTIHLGPNAEIRVARPTS